MLHLPKLTGQWMRIAIIHANNNLGMGDIWRGLCR